MMKLGLRPRFLSTKAYYEKALKVTGSGPFVELPRIKHFGATASGCCLRLPSNATLNTRLEPALQLIEGVGNVSCNLRSSCDGTLYQEIRPSCSNTFIYTCDTSASSNFAPILIAEGEVWKFKDGKYLAAWTGFDAQRNENKSIFELRCIGVFLVRGIGSLYSIRLTEKQDIFVNSDAFVGTSADISSRINEHFWEAEGVSNIIGGFKKFRFENLNYSYAHQKMKRLYEQAKIFTGQSRSDGGKKYFSTNYQPGKKQICIKGPGVVLLQS